MPWRNGAGTTRELAAAADGAWRVSVAAIPGPAPYSRFTGADRVSCVVEGEGLALEVYGEDRTVRRGDVLAYPGEAPVVGRPLDGPVQNLNLVLDRARAVGGMRVVAGDELVLAADDVLAWVLDGPDAGRVVLAGPDHGRRLRLGGGGRAVVVSAMMRDDAEKEERR
ncbi:MAG TPA: HutD family protein [Nocardioides sp.]